MLRENHVNRESKSLYLAISYTDVMNMKLLSIVTPPSIYQDALLLSHGDARTAMIPSSKSRIKITCTINSLIVYYH